MECHAVKACLVCQLKHQQEKTQCTAVLPFMTAEKPPQKYNFCLTESLYSLKMTDYYT